MARTAQAPPPMPVETAKGGSQIVGYHAEMPDSWRRLLACVNSLLVRKAPVLVCDSHAADERWMGYQYPTGTSYKHFYKFPTPYADLNNITYRARIKARGVRTDAYGGGPTNWELSYSVNGGSTVNAQVNAGAVGSGAGNSFVWVIADVALDHTQQFSTVDVWLKTFGGSMTTNNYIWCFEVEWYAEFSALPLGLYNASDFGKPLFALDVDIMGAADKGAHTGVFQTAAAICRYIYERVCSVFVSASKSWNTTSPWVQMVMENSTATMRTFLQVRALIPPGSPGVTAWIYVEDSKYSGDSDIRLSAGANTVTDTLQSSNSWEGGLMPGGLSLDCNPGDLIKIEATNIKIGTIMLMAQRAVL
jgi:hypothetical protein